MIADNEMGKRLEELSRELASDGSLAKTVMARLNNTKIEKPDKRLFIRRLTMKNRITKFAAAAVIIIGVLLSMTFLEKTTPTAYAAQVLQEAIDAVSDVWSIHMKARMRTRPSDNFANIGLNYDFVNIEMWARGYSNGHYKWRIEKPCRVLVMDGQTTIMLIRPTSSGVRVEEPLPPGCFNSWSGRLLNVRDLLNNELQRAKNNPDRDAYIWHKEVEGKDKLILEVDITTETADDDYLRNKFISESDHLTVYQFDTETMILEAVQMYVHTDDEDVLIFEVTDIAYNTEIDDSVFALDLPENITWHKEPEVLPDNERYENMMPKEVAKTFFGACARKDWEEVLKFEASSRVPDWLKNYLGGLEVISIGEPFKSGRYPGWFVPYEIKLKSGDIKKHNLAIRNDNPAKRYVVDGGI